MAVRREPIITFSSEKRSYPAEQSVPLFGAVAFALNFLNITSFILAAF